MPSITISLDTETLWKFQQTAQEAASKGVKVSRNELVRECIRDGLTYKRLIDDPENMVRQGLTLMGLNGRHVELTIDGARCRRLDEWNEE